MSEAVSSFLATFFLVAAAEMGDRTQLLALALAARYRAPAMVIAGIFAATLLNHALAAAVGDGVAQLIGADAMRWIVGASFLAFAAWALIPDKDAATSETKTWGPFVGTAILFFLVEIGDKTQLATVALAAHYGSILLVALASTLGLLAANAPVVVLGHMFADRLPMTALRIGAAALFALFGAAVLAGLALPESKIGSALIELIRESFSHRIIGD